MHLYNIRKCLKGYGKMGANVLFNCFIVAYIIILVWWNIYWALWMCDVVLVLHRLDEIYQGVKNYILIFFIESRFLVGIDSEK